MAGISTPSRHRAAALPPQLPPIGLSRDEAAAYIGVSATTLDRLIKDGMMPRPKRVYGRVVFSRADLDRAFAALPAVDDQADAAPPNPFDL